MFEDEWSSKHFRAPEGQRLTIVVERASKRKPFAMDRPWLEGLRAYSLALQNPLLNAFGMATGVLGLGEVARVASLCAKVCERTLVRVRIAAYYTENRKESEMARKRFFRRRLVSAADIINVMDQAKKCVSEPVQ